MNVGNSYKYLGIDFSTKLSFINCTSFIMKAKKSCIKLLNSLDTINCCTLDIFLKLFDSKVLAMLSNGCELWGVQDITGIERVHIFGLKRFFNASLHCQNYVVYGDTHCIFDTQNLCFEVFVSSTENVQMQNLSPRL